MRRLCSLLPTRAAGLAGIALVLSLTLLSACNRNKPAPTGGPSVDPGTAAAGGDELLLAQLRGADILASPLVVEFRQSLTKLGDPKMNFEAIEQMAAEEVGIKPSQVDAVTLCVPDFPADGKPRMLMILACNSALAKDRVFARERQGVSKRSGYTPLKNGMMLHFPDDKTMTLVHESLVDRYEGGYLKNRTSGWPLSDSFRKAAEGHTLYASFNLSKLPAEIRGERELQQFGPLLQAKTLAVSLDLKGKELRLGVRGGFPDDKAAQQAKDAVVKMRDDLAKVVAKGADDPAAAENWGALRALVKEAKRALVEAKIDTAGADLTASTSYKVEVPVGDMVVAAVQKVRDAAARAMASNNLKQIGLGLHNYHDQTGGLPIGGVGPQGQPIRDASGKPLLSWRVAILPYIEAGNLYNQFKLDEPWDSEHNKKLIDKMPKLYAPPEGVPAPAGQTFLQMVVGPSALQPGLTLIRISAQDGTSNTIAVAEAAEPVIWTKPDDIVIPGKEMPSDLKKKFGGHFKNGFLVLMWDGSVRWVDKQRVKEANLWAAITPSGGEILQLDE